MGEDDVLTPPDPNNKSNCDELILVQRMKAELERDKQKWSTRRKLAVLAFTVNTIIGFSYLVLSTKFLGSSSVDSLKEFNSIIITLIGSNSTVILAYIGAGAISERVPR